MATHADIPAVILRGVKNREVFSGNAVTDLQFSGYIRPHNETQCNGRAFAPGELRRHDLEPFAARYPAAYDLVRHDSTGGSTVLYAWRRAHAGRVVLYGATLAKPDGEIIAWYVSRVRNAADVVQCLETAARLWHASRRSEFYDSRGRPTLAYFQTLRQIEHGKHGRAWLYWRDGDEGASVDSRQGFHVRHKENERAAPTHHGVFLRLSDARDVLHAVDSRESFGA